MADFDPCECVFNHETAMRRLLSLVSTGAGEQCAHCLTHFAVAQQSTGLLYGVGMHERTARPRIGRPVRHEQHVYDAYVVDGTCASAVLLASQVVTQSAGRQAGSQS